ncbi:unnamed protein product [Rhizopus microsporus]
MRLDSLIPLLTEALSRYGTVLHVGLYRDPVGCLFFRSKVSITITTAVILEEEDDADGPDYVPSDDQSESDESEHDSDVMSIDSQGRQDIEDDVRLLQSRLFCDVLNTALPTNLWP